MSARCDESPAGGRASIAARPQRRPRRRRKRAVPLPPSLAAGSVALLPHWCREDAVQEAWVAHLSGQDAGQAARAYVRRARRREMRATCFSQLPPEVEKRILLEMPE